jgi:ribose transport system substrate-binding protein
LFLPGIYKCCCAVTPVTVSLDSHGRLPHDERTQPEWIPVTPRRTGVPRLRVVVSLPNDNAYQHEQGIVAKATGDSLGIDLQVMHSKDDSIMQSQQLLEIIQSPAASRPIALLVEPVTGAGLPRVAEAAVLAGIGWVVSNSDVEYVKQLRKSPRVPVFTVTQGQREIGRIQGRQIAALLPDGGSVLYIEGPSMSSVADQRHEGVESCRPSGLQITTLRSKWSAESAHQSVCAWLRLATSRSAKFELVAGQTHELALGAKQALDGVDDPDQRNKWLEVPFIGIGIANQVKPLVDQRILRAAVITSVTMELALRMLVRAIETHAQPPERTVVEASSFPDLRQLAVATTR